jgi:acyl-CoA synthetase (NDP forming)
MESVIGSLDIVGDLPVVRWKIMTKHADLGEFGFPCYLKADVVGHKSEMGAVVRCDNLRDAEKKLLEMHKNFPRNKIIVQEVFEGVEMIVGLKDDEVFGKLLVVGFGGVLAEEKKDISFRSLPVSRLEVFHMIDDLEESGAFSARGKKYDMERFVTLIEKVAYLGDKIDIKELDLNPVIVGEKESKIVDVRVELN